MFKTFSLRRFDFLLVLSIAALNMIGIAAIASAQKELVNRQVQGMILGIAAMLVVSLFDYTRLLKFYWIGYLVNIALLALVLIMGSTGGGAQRWIEIGGITFQPSEASKILLILFYAQFIMKQRNKMKSMITVGLCLILAVPPLLLVYRQPDLSTTIMTFVLICVMMFIGGISLKLVAAVLLVSIPSVIIFFVMVLQEGQTILDSYQQLRILAWLHPEDYTSSYSYQTMNSIMAIGSGQLMGKGYNTNEISSLLNSGYISESQTDFIFTVIGEEFGFVGGCTVIILLAVISIQLFMIARSTKYTAGSLIAAGMGTWIGFQGFMNIGVATGILPNTGIPLPFVSYGLTSLLVLYIGIGFVLNIRMQNKLTDPS